jgi:hypothetical protein
VAAGQVAVTPDLQVPDLATPGQRGMVPEVMVVMADRGQPSAGFLKVGEVPDVLLVRPAQLILALGLVVEEAEPEQGLKMLMAALVVGEAEQALLGEHP